MGKKRKEPVWLPQPEDHDYPAAEQYLSLHFGLAEARRVVHSLRTNAVLVRRAAKDIFRASGLSLLGVSNSHVAKNLKKIEDGEPLSPLLLVAGQPMLIADGYHRLCAIYKYDEDAEIPCILA